LQGCLCRWCAPSTDRLACSLQRTNHTLRNMYYHISWLARLLSSMHKPHNEQINICYHTIIMTYNFTSHFLEGAAIDICNDLTKGSNLVGRHTCFACSLQQE
jgi:hypothetical protein